MNVSGQTMRPRILGLYRRILRLAKNWPEYSKSNDKSSWSDESAYIIKEARVLFRQNAHLTDQEEIMHHIKEAESRIDLAIHYGTPYPRLINVPSNTLAAKQSPDTCARLSKRSERTLCSSMPSYLKSYQYKSKQPKN